MPKLKTHSGSKKRFNLTKSGKVKVAKAFKSHILTKKPTKRTRNLRKAAYLTGAEGKTTLNVLWWGSQTRHEMTTEMLEKFEELNPDIDVVMDYSDWDGYWTKLPAQVAGGQTPDVFQMDYAKLAEYVDRRFEQLYCRRQPGYEQRRAEYSGLRHSGRQSLRDLYWYECACYAVSQGHFG